MNIVVTGATGFLGVHLVRELLEAPERARITVLSRAEPTRVCGRLAEFLIGAGAGELATVLGARVTAMRVDLTRPRMGLAAPEFDALSRDCDVVWHAAADTRLDGDLTRLRRTNVAATRSVLDFVATARRQPRLCFVSTAFVAGARRCGTIQPDELDDTFGFENSYEQSKFEAERLVRNWVGRHRRATMILRPSFLTTDQPTRRGMPTTTCFEFIQAIASSRTELMARTVRPPRELRVRVLGDPNGRLNLLPVELAAARMARLARIEPVAVLEAHHIVHEHDVPVPMLVDVVSQALEQAVGARIELVSQPVPDPSPWERLARRLVPGVLSCLHQRRYDDTSVPLFLRDIGGGVRVDGDYLAAAVAGLASASSPPLDKETSWTPQRV